MNKDTKAREFNKPHKGTETKDRVRYVRIL